MSKTDSWSGGFPVVGIGASAGGLDSFNRLLNTLPVHPGVSIALLQHLDPSQQSMLTEILGRSSKMPVIEATDGIPIERDHVYVMPPNTIMRVSDGSLVLTKRPKTSGPALPIDVFLESLAAECGSSSIGVVLSGTGTDGMRGLAAIRAAGGLTYAEDPSSAEYDGMPRASIEAGVVDVVLDAKGIAGELTRLGGEARESEAPVAAPDEESLREILRLVRQATGLDLTRYKRTTLLRRIRRRMLLEGSDSLADYRATLEGDPLKVQALYRDVLVNMTQFFRDPAVLEALSRDVLPRIVEGKEPDRPIRIWVPGCSKGQEAYSILMVIVEYLERTGKPNGVQMFASDVNEQDIELARAGVYPEGIANEVTPERLARFFTKVPGGYQVSRLIREMCVFATHDVTQDPPFSRLDLVSFRNVLIYMERPLQERVLQVLHYALVPGGFLILGTSEAIGSDTSRFEVVDKKNKIFVRKPGPAKLMPVRSPFPERRIGPGLAESEVAAAGFDILREADKLVQGSYQPAGLVLSADLDVLQFRGDVGPFLAPAEGPPDMRLSRVVPVGLAAAVEAAVREVAKSGSVAHRSAANLRNGVQLEIDVQVVPIPTSDGASYYLALLSQRPSGGTKATRGSVKRTGADDTQDEALRLRRERDQSREQLESILSERESANADLRSARERLQSSNEELRTINEEFQTAQEELQSTNEELTTLNDELRNRNVELVSLADDLSNVIEGVEIPILILSRDLRIRRFTPQAQAIVSLKATDVGRPLSDLNIKIDADDLEDRIRSVLEHEVPAAYEVRGPGGRWYSMRIRPFKTVTDVVEGVVVVLIDIEDLKQVQRIADFARQHAEAVVDAVRQPLLTVGADLAVMEANAAYYELFGGSPRDTVAKPLFNVGNGQWDIPELRRAVEQVSDGEEFDDLAIDHVFPRLGRRLIRISGRLVKEESAAAMLLAFDDVTVATRRQALTTALNDISIRLAATLEFDKVIQQVLEESSVALGADSAALLLRQGTGLVIKATYGLPDDAVGKESSEDGLPLPTRGPRAGAPMLLTDASLAGSLISSLGVDLENGAVVLVPILFRKERIGILSFHILRSRLIFTEAEDDFMRRLATTLAFGLESAELYAVQSEIAETLQGALLSLPRTLPGVEFGYLYRSANKAAAVGGDFYDMFELPSGRIGILIGDVSGKGVKAATLTSLVRNTIRALAYEDNSPARVMARANEVILHATPVSMFVTLLFAVLDTSDGCLAYCSAGHTTGLVRREEGTIELLAVQSPLAGAFETTDFEDGQICLSGEDVLVLYTDGVTEARRDGAFFGQDGLIAAVEALPDGNPRSAPDAIYRAVCEYASNQLQDDVAIIAVALKD